MVVRCHAALVSVPCQADCVVGEQLVKEPEGCRSRQRLLQASSLLCICSLSPRFVDEFLSIMTFCLLCMDVLHPTEV